MLFAIAVLTGLACNPPTAVDSGAKSSPDSDADHVDIDGDGFPSVADGGEDCDDEDPNVYPGAPDTWYDGIDSDCDHRDDYDADGDGDRSADHGGGDCDDSNASVRPGLLELCATHADEDCDGAVDERGCGYTIDHAVADFRAEDEYFLGWRLATDCDLDHDGELEVLATSPGAEDIDGNVVHYGRLSTLVEGGAVDPSDAITLVDNGRSPESGTRAGFGSSLSCDADIDSDGSGDLVVGAASVHVDELRLGRVFGWSSPMGGATSPYDVAGFVWWSTADALLGDSVTILDFDDDGVSDAVSDQSVFAPWQVLLDDFSINAPPDLGESVVVSFGPLDLDGDGLEGYGSFTAVSGADNVVYDLTDADSDGVLDIVLSIDASDSSEDPVVGLVDGAIVVAAEPSSTLDGHADSTAQFYCPLNSSLGPWVADINGDVDLDSDGWSDLLIAGAGGWCAYRGSPTGWQGSVQPDAWLSAEFVGNWGDLVPYGVHSIAADVSTGTTVLAAAFLGAPGASQLDAGFSGRVAVWQGWTWGEVTLDDAAAWIAWTPDDTESLDAGVNRSVRFGHADGTQLWFADPWWYSFHGGPPARGRVVAFDVEQLLSAIQ